MTGSALRNKYDTEIANLWSERDPAGFVLLSEYRYRVKLHNLAEKILDGDSRVKIVMLAGPSASSKTTTARRLSDELAAAGRNAKMVSLDDFFLGLECLPVLPDGSYDMETLEGMDVRLARKCFSELMNGGESELPIFDFTRQSRSEKTQFVKLAPDDVLIIEGTHALNPVFTEGMPQEGIYGVYVSVMTGFGRGGQEVLSPRDMRLGRRIVRDQFFRGWNAEKTLKQWTSVRAGEELYIDPYVDFADVKLDAALNYEPGALKSQLLQLLSDIPGDSPYFDRAEELAEKYSLFSPVDTAVVPDDSLLREFIGRGAAI